MSSNEGPADHGPKSEMQTETADAAPEAELGSPTATSHDGSEVTEPNASDEAAPEARSDGDASQAAAEEALAPVKANWAERVVSRLEAVERAAEEFHRRAAHRESIIDRLHAENRELRAGETQAVLEPVIADLVRLLDALNNEARRIEPLADGAQPAAMLRSFASDVELILDRCGVEVFSAEPGAPYQRGQHRPVGIVVTEEPARHNTIASIVGVGLRDRMGNVRRPVPARFFSCADVAACTD